MPDFVSDNLRAIGPYWWVILTGAVMPFLDLLKFAHPTRHWEFKLHPSLRVAIIALGIIIAELLAYRDQRANLFKVIEEKQQCSLQVNSLNQQILDMQGRISTLSKATRIESPNSLRRRTIRLADEILAWEQERYEHHPPYAYPDIQRDPTPTPERQKLIDACLKYDRETFDQFNRRFKDEWIEIVRKYELENVKVGSLANDAEQSHPAQDASLGAQFVPVQMDNGTYFTALSRFRELAYHVNADGHRLDVH